MSKLLMCFLKVSSKCSFTNISIFVVGAALALTGFWGCRKDIDATTTNVTTPISQRSISIDEAKAYYESVKNLGNDTISSFSGSSGSPMEVRLTDVDPQWDFNQSGTLGGNAGLVVEATDAQFQFGEIGNIRLFFQRDNAGNLNAKYILYVADSTYHKRKQGRYENQDFTGNLLVFKPNGRISDTLMSVNGQIVSKPSAQIISSSSAAGVLSYRCRSDEYQRTYYVRTTCITGCGCVACYMEVTDCVGGGAYISGGFQLSPLAGLWSGNTFGNAFGNNASNSDGGGRSGNGGSGMNFFSPEDVARRLLVSVGGLSALSVRRLEANNYTEFLALGGLLSSDGSAAAQFVQFYYRGLTGREFTAMGSDLRGLYNVITNAGITDEEMFIKVAKVFKQYMSAGFDEAEFTKLIKDPNLFTQVDNFLSNLGYPNININNFIDIAWDAKIREGFSNLNAAERLLAQNNKIEFLIYGSSSSIAIDEAKKYSQRILGGLNVGVGNDRNIVNAFQHSYWNGLLSVNMGVDRAKTWTDAHEWGLANNPDNNFATQMDFYNNHRGREVGEEFMSSPNRGIVTLPQMIEQRIIAGAMQYVCFDAFMPNNPVGQQYTNQRFRFTNQTCP